MRASISNLYTDALLYGMVKVFPFGVLFLVRNFTRYYKSSNKYFNKDKGGKAKRKLRCV